MDKLLSIIIPVYNVEPYLRECLDSVFAQDLADCEVIAVNDGSTDDSPLILGEFESSFPDTLRVVTKENGGLSSARNAGVDVSRGRFFYFVDSDDFLKPHAIATIKQILCSDKEVDVFYMDCIVSSKGGKLASFPWAMKGPMCFREFFNYTYEHQMSITPNAFSYVYSSSYWRSCGMHFEDGIKYEDALFKYQLFVREDGIIEAVHVEDPFYVYRVGREGSISTNLTLKNFTDRQYIRRKIAQLLADYGVCDMSFRNVLFNHGRCVLLDAYSSGFLNQRNLFWDKQDLKWMRQGVSNSKDYSLYLLARMSPRWMARYYYGELPKVIKSITNLWLRLAVKLFYK